MRGSTVYAPRDIVEIKPQSLRLGTAASHGQDIAAALDDALAEYLEWERTDYHDAVEGIRRGHEDVKAGRTRPAAEFLEELREKHSFPR